jgi:hypothetical protein
MILVELVVGGSGHYTEIGSVTLRMLFFVIAVGFSIFYLLYRKVIKKDVLIIVISFTLITFLGAITGILNGAKAPHILEDIKPLSFFYILPFFSLRVNELNDIERISRIIKIGALLLAGMYILTVGMLLIGRIDFASFYASQEPFGEIIFRGGFLFFYKGFLYLCVGFIFYLFTKGSAKFFILVFLYLCIVLTLTRGFILFTTILLLYYLLFVNQNKLLTVFFSFSMILSVFLLVTMFMETIGDRSLSDDTRLLQIEQVISDVSPLSLIFGHGLGVGTEIRPIHMELSFLEIFHKQGLIGVTFWIVIFLYIFITFYRIKERVLKKLALPYLLSVTFVLLQSTTNPFMNNPIGLTIILLSIVVLSRLSSHRKLLE